VQGTCHSVVRFAQEIRDPIKDAPPSVRALAFPLIALSVTFERYGIRRGESRALFAVTRRVPD
jgi:hypothetical protein